MGEIVSMQGFLREKTYKGDVIPFFMKINASFQNFRDEDEAVFILNHASCLFVFLRYIPKKSKTDLPTLMDSFNNVTFRPRTSKGEWVVEKIYEFPTDKSIQLFHEAKNGNAPRIVSFLKERLRESSAAN